MTAEMNIERWGLRLVAEHGTIIKMVLLTEFFAVSQFLFDHMKPALCVASSTEV